MDRDTFSIKAVANSKPAELESLFWQGPCLPESEQGGSLVPVLSGRGHNTEMDKLQKPNKTYVEKVSIYQ